MEKGYYLLFLPDSVPCVCVRTWLMVLIPSSQNRFPFLLFHDPFESRRCYRVWVQICYVGNVTGFEIESLWNVVCYWIGIVIYGLWNFDEYGKSVLECSSFFFTGFGGLIWKYEKGRWIRVYGWVMRLPIIALNSVINDPIYSWQLLGFAGKSWWSVPIWIVGWKCPLVGLDQTWTKNGPKKKIQKKIKTQIKIEKNEN